MGLANQGGRGGGGGGKKGERRRGKGKSLFLLSPVPSPFPFLLPNPFRPLLYAGEDYLAPLAKTKKQVIPRR